MGPNLRQTNEIDEFERDSAQTPETSKVLKVSTTPRQFKTNNLIFLDPLFPPCRRIGVAVGQASHTASLGGSFGIR
jgi:hypothetical protein